MYDWAELAPSTENELTEAAIPALLPALSQGQNQPVITSRGKVLALSLESQLEQLVQQTGTTVGEDSIINKED